GVAVTFVDWDDMARWRLIDKSLGLEQPQPPETYHTSPFLYADLDIPTDVSGTLPTTDRTRAGLSAEVEEDLGGGRRRRRGSAPGESREETPKPARQRRRRRAAASDDPAERTEAPSTVDSADPESPKPRRRRRRRGGRGGGGTDTATG